jgi:hypothetical protein
MPNTLAHVGLQAVVSGAASRQFLGHWVVLGCLIPDLPWILQRGLQAIPTEIDSYDLRSYGIAQASLFFSLVLCAFFASFAVRTRVVLGILAGNSVLHLLIDASEEKWANGVHLLAPFDWRMLNAGWYSSDHGAVYAVSLIGCILLIGLLMRPSSSSRSFRLSPSRLGCAICLLGVYLALPIWMITEPARADNHFVSTLRDSGKRTGKAIELDRVSYSREAGNARVRIFSGEEFILIGETPPWPAAVSVRGRFEDWQTIRVSDIRVHHPWLRDAASYVGLGLAALVWVRVLSSEFNGRHRGRRDHLGGR